MNLKTTLQTLRRIEQLLDGWQTSGDIPTIERDLACDLLRRAYDDIFFTDRRAATASEMPLAENTRTDRICEKGVDDAADAPANTAAESDADGDAPVADVVSPVGLAGLAPSEEAAERIPDKTLEETPEETPENAEAVDMPVAEDAATERTAEGDAPVETHDEDVAEEEIPVEEFAKTAEAGNVVKESVDAVSPADDVATSVSETSADIVIDPVFEVFTDEGEDVEASDGAEEAEERKNAEDAEDAETVDLAGALNVADAVEAAEAADDTEIAEEMEVVEEPEIEQPAPAATVPATVPAAAPAATPAAAATPSAAAMVEPAAESAPQPLVDAAPAGTSVEEGPADAAASSTETLEEMAARFKNASGRRRKSRRAFMSLYDDDETPRRGASSDQLELSDWGIGPSDPSAKLRHTRELFGLPADDLDTTTEPTPQPEAAADATAEVDADADAIDGEIEVEVIDFTDDDNPAQSDRNAIPAAESPIIPATEPTSEPSSEPPIVPTQPTSRSSVAPDGEVQDDAEDDLSFDEAIVALDDPDDLHSEVLHLASPEHSEFPDSPEHPKQPELPDAVPFASVEIAEFADSDEAVSMTEEDEAQHADSTDVADEPTKPETATPAAFAAESTAKSGLYGREQEPELPASTPVLGEVMGHDVPTVADSLGHRPDVAGWTEVAEDLNLAISVGDRFVLLRDLFDGDQALCDRTLKRLSTFDDLDDCMIWITENFAWNANSEGAKLIMGLLERKLG